MMKTLAAIVASLALAGCATPPPTGIAYLALPCTITTGADGRTIYTGTYRLRSGGAEYLYTKQFFDTCRVGIMVPRDL